MRLAQLARNLGVTQNQIVDYLNKQGFSPLENGNYKLSEDELNAIEQKYGNLSSRDSEEQEITEQIESVESKDHIEPATANEPSDISTNEVEETMATGTPDKVEDQQKDKDGQSKSDEASEEPKEIIRAKKVKLEGIKVLGKINLPEPPPTKKKDTEEEKENAKKRRKPRKDRDQRRNKQRKKLSYTDKVKLEEERAEQERKKRKEKIKQKKKKHYFEQVQPKVKPKQAKKVKPKKTSYQSAKKKPIPKYKNPLRKLWAWLNGEYDRY